MRVKTVLTVLAAVLCLIAAGASFVSLVPPVRAVDALTLFASAFGAGGSFAIALTRSRQKKPE